MKKILMIALALGVFVYFKAPFFSSGAFDANGNPEVLVFTQDNCGTWCEKGMKDLERRDVPFTELSIENTENKQRFSEMNGNSLPYFVVGEQKVAGYAKHDLTSSLAQNFGDKYLTNREKRYFRNHFYDDDSPLVYMYGASWCTYCKKFRKEFAEQDIDFVEIDVEAANDSSMISNTMGINGFPQVYVGYVRVENAPDIKKVIDAIGIAKNRKL